MNPKHGAVNADLSRLELRFRPLAVCLALALTGAAADALAHATPGSAGQRATVPRDLAGFSAGRAESERFLGQRMAHYARMREQAKAHAKAPPRPAASIVVTNCSDAAGADGTLRAAIASAASGDTIDLGALQCSTISLGQGQIAVPLADLTIKGPGQAALTIDGRDADRVFKHSGAGSLALSDLTVAHGRHVDATHAGYYDGGCVYSLGTLALDHVTVDSCAAGAREGAVGGAVFAYGLRMTSSTVSNSRVDAPKAFGGGIGLIVGDGAQVDLVSSTIKDNGVSAILATGGGLSIAANNGFARLSLRASIVSGNTVSADNPDDWSQATGGGLFASNVGLEVKNSVVSGNLVQASGSPSRLLTAVGGGINAIFNYFEGDAVVVEDSRVSGNRAVANGPTGWGDSGGMYLLQGHGYTDRALVTLTRTTIADNHAEGQYFATRGGVGPIRAMTAAVADSTISGNQVVSSGTARCGGIDSTEGLRLTSSTVSGNTVSMAATASYGGGLCSYGDLDIGNSTIAFNSAGSNGGGIYLEGRSPRSGDRLVSSIVAGNQAAAGADLFAGNWGHPGGTAVLAGAANLVTGTDAGITLPDGTVAGDPQLLPLADNGGPTWTHALAATSLALDAGSNPSGAAFDQRGEGYLRTFGTATDIGAFELQPPPVVDRIFANGFDVSP